MAWRWTAWRLVLSAYIAFHLTATIAWVLPFSPMKQALMPRFRYYMLPCGLWQAWGMFAPDPLESTITLEAEVVDAKGMRQIYEFEKVADLPWWWKMPKFRHPKLTSNIQVEEYETQREFVCRHAVRALGIPSESFPVSVSLNIQAVPPPPLGSDRADPMTPPRPIHVASYEFNSWNEVHR